MSSTTLQPLLTATTNVNATDSAHLHGDENGTNWRMKSDPNTIQIQTQNKDLLYVVLVLTVVEPYLEQLEYYESVCTGVFISENLVITLGRCVYAAYYNRVVEPHPSFTTVHTNDGAVLRSLKIFMREPSAGVDLAMVLVEPGSGLTTFPKLPEADLDFGLTKDQCLMAGFGGRSRLSLSNFRGRKLRGRPVAEVNCRRKDRLCLRFTNLSPCRGDQGSPLICDGVLHAIFAPPSFRPLQRCVERYSAMFYRLYADREWIDSIAGAQAPFWANSFWYSLALVAIVVLAMSLIYNLLAQFVIRPMARRFERHLSEVSATLDERELKQLRTVSVIKSNSSESMHSLANQKKSAYSMWRK